ncbi:MAG: hypothetical protein AB7S77_19270 [Desulfatirhabdiaceae bacterium]
MKWVRRQDIGCKENPGTFDTGNGAMMFVDVNQKYPKIQRVSVESYCGREYENKVYYQIIDTNERFDSLKAAQKAIK